MLNYSPDDGTRLTNIYKYLQICTAKLTFTPELAFRERKAAHTFLFKQMHLVSAHRYDTHANTISLILLTYTS